MMTVTALSAGFSVVIDVGDAQLAVGLSRVDRRAAKIRSGVNGSSRYRTPVASCSALAGAGATGLMQHSAMPLELIGPAESVEPIRITSVRGASAYVGIR